MGGSTLFATTGSSDTLNATMLGVTFVPHPLVPKVAPNIVPFSQQQLTI